MSGRFSVHVRPVYNNYYNCRTFLQISSFKCHLLRFCYIIINTLYIFCIIACNLSWQNISKRDISPYTKYVNIIICIYSMATSVITHLIPFSLQEYSATYIYLARKASGVPVQLNPVMSLLGICTCFNIEIAQYIAH